jgi:mRNA interferase RelE/StbE
LSALARKRLLRLPKRAQQAVVEHLAALETDLRPPTSEELTGDLKGLRKLRVGRYRVLYEASHSEGVVRVATIGHRRMVYDEMRRLRR